MCTQDCLLESYTSLSYQVPSVLVELPSSLVDTGVSVDQEVPWVPRMRNWEDIVDRKEDLVCLPTNRGDLAWDHLMGTHQGTQKEGNQMVVPRDPNLLEVLDTLV